MNPSQHPPEPYPSGGYGASSPGAGQQPFPSSGEAGLPAEPERPATVRYALWAFIATTVVSVVAALVQIPSAGDVLDEAVAEAARTAPSGTDPAVLEAAAKGGFYGALIVGFVFSFLLLFFAFKSAAGRNWARITVTVMVVVALLFSLPALLGGGGAAVTGIRVLLGVLSVILPVVGAVLLWLAPSNVFFAEHKRRKVTAQRH